MSEKEILPVTVYYRRHNCKEVIMKMMEASTQEDIIRAVEADILECIRGDQDKDEATLHDVVNAGYDICLVIKGYHADIFSSIPSEINRNANNIFGYDWASIKRAQQGGQLNKIIDTNKPHLLDEKELICDKELLKKYTEKGLYSMQYFGVLDRLRQAGLIK